MKEVYCQRSPKAQSDIRNIQPDFVLSLPRIILLKKNITHIGN